MSGPALYASDRKNTSELRAIGDRKGWKPRKEISAAELHNFSSLEMQFHEMFSAEAVKNALDEPTRKSKAAKQRLSDMWGGKLGPEVDEAAHKAGKQFCEKYPQFIQDETNAWALHNFMQANGLDGTEIESYETAFQALAARGDLHLNPSALGIGTETRISGHSAKTHPQLYLLLRPAPTAEQIEREKTAKMSADDFKKEYLPEAGVPYHIQARMKRAADTLVSWHPDFVITDDNIGLIVGWINENKLQYDINGFEAAYQALSKAGKLELRSGAIARAGETTMTNYEPRETGEPLAPQKLRAKIRSLSSSELLQFYQDNPGAEKAVNSM